MCVFYRLTHNAIQLEKPINIKTRPNQTKQVKITKTKNINVCTNKHTYCKFTNSNKQFCGCSNRASIVKLFYQVPYNALLGQIILTCVVMHI